MLKALPSRPYAIVCIAGPLLAVLFATLVAVTDDPDTRAGITTVFLLTFGLFAVGTATLRIRSSIGRRRRAWICLAIGIWLGIVSNTISLLVSLVILPEAALASVDPILVTALLFGLAGLTLFPPAASRSTDLLRLIMDGLIVGGSVLFIGGATIFPTLLAGENASFSSQAQLLALPVLDLMMATMSILLITRSGRDSRTPLLLVGLTFLFYSVSDLAYAVTMPHGSAALGSWWDLGWLAGYLFFSLGALHPTAGEQPDNEGVEPYPLRSTIVFFGIFLIATATSMIVEVRDQLGVATRIVYALLIVIVVVRQIVLVMDNERLRRSLEVRVVERTKELKEITDQSELLLSSVADGIYGVDRNGYITMVNDATINMLGRSEEDLIGANAHDLFHAVQDDGTPYPFDGCYIAEATGSGLTASGEDDIYVRGDGKTIVVEATASPLRDDNSIRGAVVVFRDVSQRREMDRMKQEFISVISHELRTPLTSIRGALGLVAGGALGELPPRAAHMVEIASTGSVRLGRLVNDILEIERLDTGMLPLNVRNHDVAAACKEAIVATSGLAQAAGVTLTLGTADGRVRADRDRLVQVLINLVGNAVRFSDPGDAVLLEAEPVGDQIEFAVSDTGRGIPPDKLETIFGRFSQVDSSDTREKGGTGLGLAICRGLVERMGGRIWAESTLGKGSTFRFELPMEGEADAPTGPSVPTSAGVAAS